ncbi:MAG: bifunctional (p)ppGpp synthetase/guanosine-3',5'-bis(diphosphate) 3'-pyrophosphohydrolase [Bacteroidales bacterium]|nr:bifunctional (p)ppGpp synthetase/guanosine-3',5'-bis(diphosphate) 3'-pyrophosphohydrolase [Bacteroidales bacterium]
MDYVIDEQREEQEIQAKYDELLVACRDIYPITQEQEDEIFRAFSLAKKAHAGTRRKSGEPYIFHPLAVALIAVKEVGLGPIAVVCALLHDVVEDTNITLDEIRTIFGDRVAVIVDGVTKIEDVIEMHQSDSKQAENYRKILLSMCDDAYVIFLKLCDRLHNMRTLGSMKDTKKLTISSETQYLYVPLAHRLGLYAIKTELEELVMKYTNPDKYNEIAALVNKSAGTGAQLKECIVNKVRQMLDDNGYKYTIKTRIKSVYSCWKKMERKGVKFDEIFDLFAMRIILDVPPAEEKSECFKVYSLITSVFRPDPTRFRDWITQPKTNGYESLQTTVMTPIGKWVEIQIRTERMDLIAEKGMAAHFLYKEAHPEENIEMSPVEVWLQQIRSTLENTEKSALDLVEEFKETLYTKEIYLFTPKGDMKTLPSGSTVLDFAFAIHTNLGLHCMGAKVNGKVEPIGYKLRAGEQVQVLASRKAHPVEDWLNMVHTTRAKDALKDYLREQRKGYRQEGAERLQEIFKRLKIKYNRANIGQLRHFLKVTNEVDLYFQLAMGIIGEKEICDCFNRVGQNHNVYFMGEYSSLFDKNSTTINLGNNYSNEESQMRQRSFLLDAEYEHYTTEPAPCCKPVQGDHVIGVVSNGKIMVHRTTCKVAVDEMANHENRIVRARWRAGEHVALLSGIAFTAIDQKGLLQEITRIVSEEMNLNMRAITVEAVEGIVRGIIMLYVLDLNNLNQLIANLENIKGVQEVRRL